MFEGDRMLGFKSTKKKSNANLDEENIHVCKESLIKAISNVIDGKVSHINEEDLGCKEIAALWNKMLDSICQDKKKSTFQANNILRFVTEMDFVKEMIDDVRIQSRTFHNIAASSEEMSASIDDVSSFVEKVADTTNKAQNVAIEGEENINKAFSFVNESFKDIDTINNEMKNVMEKTEKINQIVDIVKGIAEQTNLLALNAAIEAARAGEHGKGFAVVADEVRKLAEHTKQSVSDIQKNTNELKVNVEESVDKAQETTLKLDTGKKLVDNALSSIGFIIQNVKQVNDSVLQVSANVEEQTAVTVEIAKEINSLNELTDNLLGECDKTGKAIFDVSNLVNELRLTQINNELCLDDNDLLEICIADHLIWRWRVYNMILGYDKIDINNIGTHEECRLGKWYYSNDSKDFVNNKVFIDLEEPHIKLHELAREATLAYERGDIKAAERALEQMNTCSKLVIDALSMLKK